MSNNAEDKKRTFKFKLDGETETIGRYKGASPVQAAKKGISKYFQRLTADDKKTPSGFVNFEMVESTRGSKGKISRFRGKRVKLDKPVTYQIGGGTTITKEYEYIVESRE